MAFVITSATKKVFALSKRIRAVQGGTSASKTISILSVLIHKAQRDTAPTITSVVSESLPHLKLGAIRDFQAIMKTQNYWEESRWSATNFTYTFETGSVIEFFGVENEGKVTGPRRDRLFINEANNVPLHVFNHMEVRTKEFVFMDWNPSVEFWFYTDVLGKRDDIAHITLTYLDNEALDRRIRDSIETRRNNPSWWKVYGEGQLGEVLGRIYTGWQVIDVIPHEAKLISRGMDFGYSNDPASIIDIYSYNGGFILDELLYGTGYLNSKLADTLKAQTEKVMTIADSSEPKSIDEIRGLGVTIMGAKKGPGSVNQGIAYVQQQKISVTRRSANLLKEYRGYLWLPKPDGTPSTVPQDDDNHAMDAVRYGFDGRIAADAESWENARKQSILAALDHGLPTIT